MRAGTLWRIRFHHPGESAAVNAQGNTEGVVVAIDGPSGSGKSSTSKGVAKALGLQYLDTGAMYRALTWWMLTNGVDVDDTAAVASVVARPTLVMGTDPEAPAVAVDERDVSAEIRGPEVTANVSAVSAVPEARELLVRTQRAIIEEATRNSAGSVVEWRDITTVVARAAPAQRRSKEFRTGYVAATQADLARRDELDSNRTVSPLTQTEDATELDTTGLSLDEVIALIVELVDKARGPVAAAE